MNFSPHLPDMNRRAFLKHLGKSSLLAAVAGVLSQSAMGQQQRKPNIIFILADDLGYGEIGCYGQQRIRTPRIDSMASQGMRFTQAYAGCTVCAPSRCSLMTGMHMGHATVRGNNAKHLKPEDVTVAKLLKEAGYATANIGKWGLGGNSSPGAPNKQGFDYFFGYLSQTAAHAGFPAFLWRNTTKVPLPENADGKQGVWSSDLFTAEARKFIEEKKDVPFFLYLTYTVPHANSTGKKQESPTREPYANEKWPEPEILKAASITRMDEQIGGILDLLKQLNLDDNTLVIFSSDNGPHKEGGVKPDFFKSSGPLRGIKRDNYEGGIRVPFIARWPGHVPAGVTSDQITAFWDFLPTVAELAGAASPKGIDGISILPTLTGKPQTQQHEYLYWEFHEKGFFQAVRFGDWKAVRLGTQKPIELYNLKTDLGEKNNIAADHPDLVERARKYMTEGRTESDWYPITEGKPAPKAEPEKEQ